MRSELQILALFSAIAIALELENLSSEMLRIDIIGGGVGSTASGGTLTKVESYIWEREVQSLLYTALYCTILKIVEWQARAELVRSSA